MANKFVALLLLLVLIVVVQGEINEFVTKEECFNYCYNAMLMPAAVAERICKWRCQYPMWSALNSHRRPKEVGSSWGSGFNTQYSTGNAKFGLRMREFLDELQCININSCPLPLSHSLSFVTTINYKLLFFLFLFYSCISSSLNNHKSTKIIYFQR
ncbi:unnamed protein product [Trifolium pratense]|uniref:Uncharacterized protein n=1 Tax=Trifolium pratense TaxID=57577 RepID=A0ACB0K5E8_TRIPR|nr:unnamed protein product [Trifolium pratense]